MNATVCLSSSLPYPISGRILRSLKKTRTTASHRRARPDEFQDIGSLAGLSRRDLIEVMFVLQGCLANSSDDNLHRAIRRFGDYLGYEFILYAYTQAGYNRNQEVFVTNLSNPPEWMNEYARMDLLSRDPVRIEFELRLKRREHHGVILWDRYDRDLSDDEKQVIALRRSHGLR